MRIEYPLRKACMTEKGGRKLKWLEIDLITPPELSDALANFLTETGAQGIYEESPEISVAPGDFPEPPSKETIKAFFPFDSRVEDHLAALDIYLESLDQLLPGVDKPQYKAEIISDMNWGEEWKKYFKPLRVSKTIVIKPTWERYTPEPRDIIIEMDPGMAFGTGQHPSTRMCLEALEDVLLKDRTVHQGKVLDVGTGTGILGIAAAKLGSGSVICVDIDKKATEVARENVVINQVADRVEVLNRDVTTIEGPFDLILANLTARILLKLRQNLTALLKNGGYMIISGIIDQNRPDIEAHFLKEPFSLHHTIMEKEWVCYILRKGS